MYFVYCDNLIMESKQVMLCILPECAKTCLMTTKVGLFKCFQSLNLLNKGGGGGGGGSYPLFLKFEKRPVS